MPYNASALSARERQMVDQLVIALRARERVLAAERSGGLALYKALEKRRHAAARNMRHYLFINGSRWDLVDENEPFVGKQPMPPGHELYPADLTRARADAYVAAHRDRKALHVQSVHDRRRSGDRPDRHASITTSSRAFMKPAAARAAEGGDLSDDPAFANFLRLRADALLTDDYYASDLAWLDLKNPKFDMIFAPYETYLDDLLGVKTSYGASILIRNEARARSSRCTRSMCRTFRTRCRWRPPTGRRSAATSRRWK